jgi:hypothetical protein
MSRHTHRSLRQLALAASAAVVLASNAYAEEPKTTASPTPAEQTKASTESVKRAPRPGDIQRVFVIKHENVRALAEVLSAFPATLTYSTWKQTNALGVSAPPAVMAAIEETIKRLDMPPARAQSVDITAYVIEALPTSTPGAMVPAVLNSVVAQLKATFRYADYRLVDTLITRAAVDPREPFEMNSVSEGELALRGARYSARAFPEVIGGNGTSVVRLGRLRFDVVLEVQKDGKPLRELAATFKGTIDILDGQYVVVGKSGTGDPGNAVILVLHAKIVD